MELKIFTWNTGRLYGREGQRIAATVVDDKRIVFADLDRHIDGEFPLARQGKRWDKFAIESLVMNAYDFGNYTEHAADGDYVRYREITSQLMRFAREHAPKLRGAMGAA